MTSLHITNAWHPQSGGIRTFYLAMLRGANSLRRPMRLAVPGERDGVEDVGQWGRIYTVRAPRAPFVDRRYRVLLPHLFLSSSGAIRGILRRERPDVLEICDKYALPFLGGWVRRHLPRDVPRPTIIGLSCERADDSLRALGLAGRIAAPVMRRYLGAAYLPQCDYHLANSGYTAGELRAAQRARHKREVHEIPMGVDCAAFGARYRSDAWRSRWCAQLGLPDTGVVIVYAGRLAQEKRLSVAIDVLAYVRARGVPAGLVLVGAGPDQPRLQRQARRLVPGHVGFAGQAESPGALAMAYASADVFLHVNPCEPFGIAPLEAMASGVPVVLPRAGGVLSYADDANAWLAEPRPDALAAAVVAAVTHAQPARLQRALLTAAAYDWSHSTSRVFEMYDRLHEQRLTTDRGRWPAAGHRAPPLSCTPRA